METALVCMQAYQKSCFTSLISIGFLPYLYFSDGSPFRTTWFDIYVTCIIWFSTVQNNLVVELPMEAMGKLDSAGSGDLSSVKSVCLSLGGGFVSFANTILLFTLSIIYFPDAKAGFEYGWTLFIIIMCSIGLGCGMCQLCVVALGKAKGG
jgi:hypothetical protein